MESWTKQGRTDRTDRTNGNISTLIMLTLCIMRMEGESEMENNLYHRELFTVENSSFSL